VDSAGQPLDPVPLLGSNPGDPSSFTPQDVVWDGSQYVVVGKQGIGTSQTTIRLFPIRDDGRFGSAVDIVVADEVSAVAAAASGSDIALVYSSKAAAQNGSTVIATIVHNGQVGDRWTLGSSDDYKAMATGRVIGSPAGFLVLWPHNFRILARNGAMTSGGALAESDLDATWNGSSYAVVGADPAGITLFTVSAEGVVGASTTVHTSTYAPRLPSIAWSGAEYRVIWNEATSMNPCCSVPWAWATYDLIGARIDANFHPISEAVLVSAVAQTGGYLPPPDSLTIRWTGTSFLSVWTTGPVDSTSILRDVYDFALPPTSMPTQASISAGAQLISHRAEMQLPLAVAATPDGARVFWSSESGHMTGSIDVLGRHGAPTTLPFTAAPMARSAAWNGVDFVLSGYLPSQQMAVGLVDRAGTLVRTAQYSAGGRSRIAQAIACNTSDCAIVWAETDATDVASGFFQRIASDGSPIDQPVPLPALPVALSGGGNEYLIAMTSGDAVKHYFAARYADGKLQDSTQIWEGFASSITAASRPDGWLVVLIPLRVTPNSVVHAVHLDSTAAVTRTTDIVFPPQLYVDTTVATWDGRDWIVLWQQPKTYTNNDLFAARIATDGTLLDPGDAQPGFPLAARDSGEDSPMISSIGNGLTAVAYRRFTNDQTYGLSTRVFVRWIDNR
jgi:hypothetical protein